MSLNIVYLTQNLITKTCDNISAYALAWPLPSKMGAACAATAALILLYQYYRAYHTYERI